MVKEQVGPTGMMEAVELSRPNTFQVRSDIPVPSPQRNEVLCRVRAATICGTDTHIFAGDFPGFWPTAFPFIPGHEWSGEVVALGPDVDLLGWDVGDRVAGTSHAACGFCAKCVEGRYNVCENYGRDKLHFQYGHNTQGAFATYVVHSVKSVFKIPDSLEFDDAALLDPASIALHTARRGGVRPGDTVAVTGAGVLGLLAADAALAVGAARVIVVGRGQRLDVAEKLGHDTVNTESTDPVVELRSLTEGLGVDVALECAGTPEMLQACIDALRRGGRCAVVGIPAFDAELPLRHMVLDELDVVGVRASAGEMRRVIPLVTGRRIRVSELITHRFPLSSFAEAFEVFKTRRDGALKVILNP